VSLILDPSHKSGIIDEELEKSLYKAFFKVHLFMQRSDLLFVLCCRPARCRVLTMRVPIAGWREALFALPRRLFSGAGVPSTEGGLAGADDQVRTLFKSNSNFFLFSFENECIYIVI
jgi:hypothetical protein